MRKRIRNTLLILLAVALVAGAVLIVRRPHTGAPAVSLAGQAASPAPASAPATAEAAQPADAPASAQKPLTLEQFVDISSVVVIGALEVQHRPNAAQLLPSILQTTLDHYGVSIEEYNAFAQKIHDDPARSQAVANAILNRVAQRTTPQVRVQAVPLAKALAMKLQQQQVQQAESAATGAASSH